MGTIKMYWEFTRKSFQRAAVYRADAWTRIFGNLMTLSMWGFIWYALYYGKDSVENVSFHATLSYIMISLALQGIHNAGTPLWEIQERVRTGDIAIEILRPYDYPIRMLFSDLGSMTFYFITAVIPLYSAIFLLFQPVVPGSLAQLGIFFISVILGYLIRYSLELTFGLFTFWLVETGGVEDIFYFSISLFSGAIVPLWFFPDWLERIAYFLPFQGIFFVPNSIFVGQLTGQALLISLVSQVIWLVICWGILRLVWSKASMKIVVQGG
ncbi:ABC transporter permease [Dehalobacterium formicoaceticum]|uniref:ABC-2 family transporter protein n=1 Tax=Dehalobacterium formicoaceticum TaxID=51515 RepID=A0ABT1Y7K7_9FIRM|nr:ABC-2 family transporter protein [Dehalobacterium formicoaceticum]MCR6546869.1 ABC-2 family transporter protein [Dehalobacterium formicoaceticum]